MTRLSPEFLRVPLAHRSLHDVSDGRPENSQAGIRAAIAAGYGIEIDLQLSSDDQAMVFHDYDLARLTGTSGPLRLRTANDLSKMTLTGGDEGIPTLQDVLQLVRGRVPLLIEIKDQDGAMGTNIGLLERATSDAIAAYRGPVAVMSYNPNSVAEMARLAPGVARGLVTRAYDPTVEVLPVAVCDQLREISDFDRVGAAFISHEIADLMRPRVAALLNAGAHVLCWTVRSPEQEEQARKVAENITFENYLAPIPT
jgi:glycerophosphoryl diester phosphodiesterase